MNVYVALLRGINVGGANKILMADLKALFITLNFPDPSTYLQSGNVVFSTIREDISAIEIELKLKATSRNWNTVTNLNRLIGGS